MCQGPIDPSKRQMANGRCDSLNIGAAVTPMVVRATRARCASPTQRRVASMRSTRSPTAETSLRHRPSDSARGRGPARITGASPSSTNRYRPFQWASSRRQREYAGHRFV
jgi:hypothetical protein